MAKRADGKEMSFLDHLEELRWHIIRSMIAIGIFAILAFIFKNIVFGVVIFGPYKTDFLSYQALCWISQQTGMGDKLCVAEMPFSIINLDMAGQFLTHIKVSFLVGVILASPYILWEVWRFVRPALYNKERKYTKGMVAICSSLFLVGVLFGYFFITPFSVQFLGSYQVDPSIGNTINLGSYIGVLTMICMASGIIFELPVASYILSKIGLLTPEFMRKYRRHSIVFTLVLSAVITPPDVASQILIAIPILILYEISIVISARVNKQLKEQME